MVDRISDGKIQDQAYLRSLKQCNLGPMRLGMLRPLNEKQHHIEEMTTEKVTIEKGGKNIGLHM